MLLSVCCWSWRDFWAGIMFGIGLKVYYISSNSCLWQHGWEQRISIRKSMYCFGWWPWCVALQCYYWPGGFQTTIVAFKIKTQTCGAEGVNMPLQLSRVWQVGLSGLNVGLGLRNKHETWPLPYVLICACYHAKAIECIEGLFRRLPALLVHACSYVAVQVSICFALCDPKCPMHARRSNLAACFLEQEKHQHVLSEPFHQSPLKSWILASCFSVWYFKKQAFSVILTLLRPVKLSQ